MPHELALFHLILVALSVLLLGAEEIDYRHDRDLRLP